MQPLAVKLNKKLMLNPLPFSPSLLLFFFVFYFVLFELHPYEMHHQKVPGEVYVSTDCSFCGRGSYLKTNIVLIASNFGINVFSWTNFVVFMSQAERDGPVPMKLAPVFLFLFRVIDALVPLHPPLMTGISLFIVNEPRELHQPCG